MTAHILITLPAASPDTAEEVREAVGDFLGNEADFYTDLGSFDVTHVGDADPTPRRIPSGGARGDLLRLDLPADLDGDSLVTLPHGFEVPGALDEDHVNAIALIDLARHIVDTYDAEHQSRDTLTAWRLTVADLDAIAGRELDEHEVVRIATAIDNSTAGDAIAAAVEQVAGHPDDDEDPVDEDDLTPDTDPGDDFARSRALSLPVLEDDSTGTPLEEHRCDNVDAHGSEPTSHQYAPEGALVTVKRDTSGHGPGVETIQHVKAGAQGIVLGHFPDCHHAHVLTTAGQHVWIDPQLLHVEPVASVEFSPCRERDDATSVCEPDEAEFWTVYTREQDGTGPLATYPATARVDYEPGDGDTDNITHAAVLAESLALVIGATYGVPVYRATSTGAEALTPEA